MRAPPGDLLAAPQLETQDWDLGWEVWALLVFATLGPLVLTNILWFRSLHRIGPSRATSRQPVRRSAASARPEQEASKKPLWA